jgi:hypothetical protein
MKGDAPTPAHRESFVMMDYIDNLPKAVRALIREYGFVVVTGLLDDGHANPLEMAELLEEWRRRRQEQCLETNYITRKTAQSVADAIQYRTAASQWLKHS